MYYWQNAHRYFSYKLKSIYPIYNNDGSNSNKIDIENREKERERFLEFNFALGGLLLYSERYFCINRIFQYTTSIPPKYELLPESMDSIFNHYMKFKDPYEDRFSFISHTYPFPDLEGLNADYSIKKWICEYIALLLLRQYSIQPYLITMRPLALPSVPNNQAEKKTWINNIDFLKTLLNNVKSNNDLLRITKLDFITDDWLTKNDKPNPEKLIDIYKEKIEKDYQKTEIEQELQEEKVKAFNDTSISIIKNTLDFYKIINNENEITENYNSWYINGERAIIDKSPFTSDTDTHHLNFDSFLSSSISDKIKIGISETFFYNKSKSYLLREKDIFKGIDKLKIDNNFIIISFSQNLKWLKESLQIPELENNKYKGIDIIDIPVSNYHLVGQAFFILRKNDLPNLKLNDIKKEEIDKYLLQEIDNNLHLYSTVLNLYKHTDIINELQPSNQDKDLRKQVLIGLSILIEIRWKKKVDNVMIRTYTEYRERGIPDNLNNVVKI